MQILLVVRATDNSRGDLEYAHHRRRTCRESVHHDEHYQALCAPGVEVRAVASPTIEHVRTFAEKRGIPRWFVDYREMFARAEIELVVLGLPNYLHCDAVLAAAAAGKHVALEKPMAMNLAECDQMIDACRRAGVKLMYAEESRFAPNMSG